MANVPSAPFYDYEDDWPDEPTVTCGECFGSGLTPEGWDCPECDGTGYWEM